MRISDSMLSTRIRANLNANMERLSLIQEEIATGRRLSRPAQDPSGTASVLRYRTERVVGDQYTRTLDAGRSRLEAADTALGNLTSIVQRVRELTVQAGSDATAPAQLATIATEVNQLLNHAVQIGNTSFGGQYIFGGTRTTTPPFSVASDTPPSVTFAGNTAPITLDVGPNTRVRVDVQGDATFLPVMNALIQIRDALNLGNGAQAVQTGLPALDFSLDALLTTRGSVGARVNTMDHMAERLNSERVNLANLQAGLEDADVTDAVVRLNSARNVYEAALGAAAKAIKPSLADFLR